MNQAVFLIAATRPGKGFYKLFASGADNPDVYEIELTRNLSLYALVPASIVDRYECADSNTVAADVYALLDERYPNSRADAERLFSGSPERGWFAYIPLKEIRSAFEQVIRIEKNKLV